MFTKLQCVVIHFLSFPSIIIVLTKYNIASSSHKRSEANEILFYITMIIQIK